MNIASNDDANDTQLNAHEAGTAQVSLRSAIRAPCRSRVGIQPWSRGGGLPPVKVMHVKLDGAKVPKLDGAEVVSETRETVRFEPPVNGTLVLVVGMGGMKTFRVIEWLSEKQGPTVVVTARRNLAYKIESDLRRVGIDCRNYLDAPEGQSTKKWCKQEVVIVSGEQVHILDEWRSMYKGGSLVIDEFGTLAASFGGSTIKWPQTTMAVLKELATLCSHTILMDADADIDGKCEAFIRSVAPMNDVLYVQSTVPAMKRTLIYGFKSNEEHRRWFEEWLEYSLMRSRDARRSGTPNRTFYGGATPRQVIKRAYQATQLGMEHGCYHGKSSEQLRKLHFGRVDQYMEKYDAIFTSTVMAVGTDMSLKCSWGFFETARGCATHGVSLNRMVAQLTGRPGRSSETPLDAVTLGSAQLDGALFMLIDDTPPEITTAPSETDRVERKFFAVRHAEMERLSAIRRADAGALAAYIARRGLRIDHGDGVVGALPTAAAPMSIEGALAEVSAWNEVERRDQYEAHTINLFELCILPTRGYHLQLMEGLNPSQQLELQAFRRQEKEEPSKPLEHSEDRRVADMDPQMRFTYVVEEVERREAKNEGTADDYWHDCFGHVPRDGSAQPIGNARAGAMREVWSVLKDVRAFPECQDDYADLYVDRNRRDIYNRALMRFVPEADIKVAEVRAEQTGHAADSVTAVSLTAGRKMPLLTQFAQVLGLQLTDLLEPRTFTAEEHAWVDAHNRMQRGRGTKDDEAMTKAARSKAVEMGCKGLRSGSKCTGLHKTIEAVLVQQCGMKPATSSKNGLKTTQVGPRGSRAVMIVSWEVGELAPGYAEKMLLYHPAMHEFVPAAEYQSRFESWQRLREEERREQRDRLEQMHFEAEMGFEEEDEMAVEEAVAMAAPYDPNVRYVPFEASKIIECLDDWRTDEKEREAAERVLLELIAKRSGEVNKSPDDAWLSKLRGWRSKLRRMSTRHAIVSELDKTLPPADANGRRTRREVYEYKPMAMGKARHYVRGEWRDYGDGELRTLGFHGLPSDVRIKLCGRYFYDADGVCSDFALYLHEAKQAGLPASATKLCKSYILDRDGWHERVASWHKIEPSATKRWPNILGNGGGYAKCLQKAELRSDSERCSEVLKLQEELRRLRKAILDAPCNKAYVDALRAHLKREVPSLDDRERDNKVFSYLIETTEDRVQKICAATFRRLAREAVGAEGFDMLPVEYRDTGAFVFDGQAVEARDGFDVEAGLRHAEADLEAQGIEYRLALKEFYGLQDRDMDSVTEAREALAEATADCEEGRAAVTGDAASKAKRPISARSAKESKRSRQEEYCAAFLVPVKTWDPPEPRVLMTVERRNGVTKLGLLGGKVKAEDGGDAWATAIREAREESAGLLSNTLDWLQKDRRRYGEGWSRQCKAHVFVSGMALDDWDVDTRWPESRVVTEPGSTTEHLGLRWVKRSSVVDREWRKAEMHDHAAMVVTEVAGVLEGMVAEVLN